VVEPYKSGSDDFQIDAVAFRKVVAYLSLNKQPKLCWGIFLFLLPFVSIIGFPLLLVLAKPIKFDLFSKVVFPDRYLFETSFYELHF
jgi:hypothetical protein